MSTNLPIVLINKILDYKCQLNNELIIIQYDPITQKECYKINKLAGFLWKLKSLMIMKRLYPIIINPIDNNNRKLYKFGLMHYEINIRNNIYP
jgi:hypothetical protein